MRAALQSVHLLQEIGERGDGRGTVGSALQALPVEARQSGITGSLALGWQCGRARGCGRARLRAPKTLLQVGRGEERV